MNMKPLVQNLVKNFKTVMESVQPCGICLSLCTVFCTFTKQAPIAVTLKITSVPRLPDLWPDLMGGRKSKESTCRMSHMIHFQMLGKKRKTVSFFFNITVLFSKNVFQKQSFTFSILQPSCSIHLPIKGEVPELIKMQNTSVSPFSSLLHFDIWNKVCSSQHTFT